MRICAFCSPVCTMLGKIQLIQSAFTHSGKLPFSLYPRGNLFRNRTLRMSQTCLYNTSSLQELRRYLDYFKQSGKKSVAYMYTGGNLLGQTLPSDLTDFS